jgi:O-antigen/teichoic acid export membrane protein
MKYIIKKIKEVPFEQLFNAALRISPVFLKFIVVILFAEALSLKQYGTFNLIITSVTVGLYLLGLDFYYFSNREIITNKEKRLSYILSSFVVYGIVYCVLYALTYIIFPYYFSNKALLNSVILVLISEHFNQECYRILICLKKVFFANAIFFFRVSSWTSYTIYLILFSELSNDPILAVLNYWLISNALAITGIAVYAIFKKSVTNEHKKEIDLQFIKKGLKLSLWVFLGTILLKTTEYSGRFITEFFLGNKYTAIFTYYSTIAIAMNMYINAVVTSYEYPKLVESVNTKTYYNEFSLFKKKLLRHVVFCGILILFFGYFITSELSEREYLKNFWVLPVMVVGVILMNLSLGNHFNLYAHKKDKSIIWINVYSGLITIVVTTALIYWLDLLGGAISFLLSGAVILFLRRKQVLKHEI